MVRHLMRESLGLSRQRRDQSGVVPRVRSCLSPAPCLKRRQPHGGNLHNGLILSYFSRRALASPIVRLKKSPNTSVNLGGKDG